MRLSEQILRVLDNGLEVKFSKEPGSGRLKIRIVDQLGLVPKHADYFISLHRNIVKDYDGYLAEALRQALDRTLVQIHPTPKT